MRKLKKTGFIIPLLLLVVAFSLVAAKPDWASATSQNITPGCGVSTSGWLSGGVPGETIFFESINVEDWTNTSIPGFTVQHQKITGKKVDFYYQLRSVRLNPTMPWLIVEAKSEVVILKNVPSSKKRITQVSDTWLDFPSNEEWTYVYLTYCYTSERVKVESIELWEAIN